MAYTASQITLVYMYMKGLNKTGCPISFFCVFFVSKGNLLDFHSNGNRTNKRRGNATEIQTRLSDVKQLLTWGGRGERRGRAGWGWAQLYFTRI